MMMKNSMWMVAAVAAAGIASTPALADEEHEHEHAHLDFSPTLVDGKVVANGWDDAHAEFHAGESVFGWEFGEVVGSPYYIQDPGFNVRPGSGFTQGTSMGLRVVSPLRYWDGQDADADTHVTVEDVLFEAPVGGESITLSFGPSERVVTGSSGTLADLFAGTQVGADGSTHFHLDSTIAGSGGDPTSGVYAFQAQLLNSGAGVEASEPVWLVYVLGASEEAHGAAMAALVPEPATAGLLLAGAGLVALRRKRA